MKRNPLQNVSVGWVFFFFFQIYFINIFISLKVIFWLKMALCRQLWIFFSVSSSSAQTFGKKIKEKKILTTYRKKNFFEPKKCVLLGWCFNKWLKLQDIIRWTNNTDFVDVFGKITVKSSQSIWLTKKFNKAER